jgi:hypothetical protein
LRQPDWTSYRTILIAAFIIRVIAAIFSQGYGMHDDHFLIVEAAKSWVDGYDYNHWLPWSPDSTGQPEGHSFTYVGLNYYYFLLMDSIGVNDPKVLMLVNRLLHAFLSMLVVYFGIKITEKLSTRENAVAVGWLLALLWMMPFLSVRNLVEVACIPFLIWGTWLLIKNEKRVNFLLAGILIGLAISFRYHVGAYAIGLAVYYIFKKKWTEMFLLSGGILLIFCITQGLVDFIIWGYPFAEMIGYFTYNANEGTQYIPNHDPFMYLEVLSASCLVPLGLLIAAGFFTSARKYGLLFIPVLFFIVFHTLYPSKQERFILPVLPFFIMLGVMGYHAYFTRERAQKFWRFSMKAFWVLNIPLLLIVSVAYTKKSRVEAMYYFYESNEVPQKILMEATGETGVSMPPNFYAGHWRHGILERTDTSQLLTVYPTYNYDYILFYGEQDLDKRVGQYKTLYPGMERVKVCEPSFVDRFLRWLNPRNTNEYIEVWKTHAQPS